MVELEDLGGSMAQATGLNERGEILVFSQIAGKPNPAPCQAVNWTVGGQIVDLGTLGGSVSVPSAMNQLGHVVGYSLVPGDNVHAGSCGQKRTGCTN
jgi:uncharacterized membrane protein